MRWYAIPRYAIEVDKFAEAAAAAELVAEWGADFLTVIVDRIPHGAPRICGDSLPAAVHVASSRGLRTVAHIGTTGDAGDAARAHVAAWGTRSLPRAHSRQPHRRDGLLWHPDGPDHHRRGALAAR